jgi:hypothetical protein
MRRDFHNWLFTICPLSIASLNKRDTIEVYDDEEGKKVHKRKYFYSVYV